MSEQRGYLVPPAWIEENGFTPETWQQLVEDEFGPQEAPMDRRAALRAYLHTTQGFTRQQIWGLILVALGVGLVVGLVFG